METGVKSAELDAAQHALKCAQLLLGGWDQTEALSDPKTTRSPNPQGSETAVLAAQRVSMGIRMAARGYSRDVNRGGPVLLAGGDGPDATFRSRMAEAGAPFDSKLVLAPGVRKLFCTVCFALQTQPPNAIRVYTRSTTRHRQRGGKRVKNAARRRVVVPKQRAPRSVALVVVCKVCGFRKFLTEPASTATLASPASTPVPTPMHAMGLKHRESNIRTNKTPDRACSSRIKDAPPSRDSSTPGSKRRSFGGGRGGGGGGSGRVTPVGLGPGGSFLFSTVTPNL